MSKRGAAVVKNLEGKGAIRGGGVEQGEGETRKTLLTSRSGLSGTSKKFFFLLVQGDASEREI